MEGLDLDLSGLSEQDRQAVEDFARYLQMKARAAREADRDARNSARGLRMKLLPLLGACPICGKPTTGTRRAGEDHSAEVGAVVFVPCGCRFGCGHIDRY